MTKLTDYHSYYDFLKKNVSQDEELPVLVKHAHHFFASMTKLLAVEEVPSRLRSKCFIALGYFLVPDDIFPEDEHGPIGFIEDVMVSMFVQKEIISHLGETGKQVVIESLNVQEELYEELLEDFTEQLTKFEEPYLKALHYTGLISDQEFEDLIGE